jgi:hypothetical protein
MHGVPCAAQGKEARRAVLFLAGASPHDAILGKNVPKNTLLMFSFGANLSDRALK